MDSSVARLCVAVYLASAAAVAGVEAFVHSTACVPPFIARTARSSPVLPGNMATDCTNDSNSTDAVGAATGSGVVVEEVRWQDFTFRHSHRTQPRSARRYERTNRRFPWIRLPLRNQQADRPTETGCRESMHCTYQYSLLKLQRQLPARVDEPDKFQTSSPVLGILLIHPIGVGIGRWFYNRLLDSFKQRYTASIIAASANSSLTTIDSDLLLVAPDLLGSDTASNIVDDQGSLISKPPLTNVSDWTAQLGDLMKSVEEAEPTLARWCIVANGGCSPIALQLGQRSVAKAAAFSRPVQHVVLSSTPRMTFFLNPTDPSRVARSYRILCGPVGSIFWWYACRNNGRFIRKFSEKNLVADSSVLGYDWTANCIRAATTNDGRSKYSAFSFLAGALQDGCVQSLSELCTTQQDVLVHIIKGRDSRPNKARSWFWRPSRTHRQHDHAKTQQPSLAGYLRDNGVDGRRELVDGRISLAYEDADGYCGAILRCIATSANRTTRDA